MRQPPHHPDRDAFSLVELLVVIAVVAVIAGVLLPVLVRGKGSAQQSKCASNLRQLGLAAEMYWEDHHGLAFPYRTAGTNNGDVFWFGWLELANGANEGQRAFDFKSGPLYPYLRNWHATLCPALAYHHRKFKLKATTPTCGYGVNLYLTAPKLRNVSVVKSPAEIALFADAAQVNTFQVPASPENPMLEEFYYLSTNKFEATAHFRHRHKANVVFCDGHVEQVRPQEGSMDIRMPEANVGRLAPERLGVP